MNELWIWLLIVAVFVLLICAVGAICLIALGCGVSVVSYLIFRYKKRSFKMDEKFMKAYVKSAAGQIVIRDWSEDLRNRVGNPDAYLKLVLDNNAAAMAFDLFKVEQLMDTLEDYAKFMSPGHDIGHFRRDGLSAMILFNGINGHPADKLAGLIAGWAHDIGNAMTARYQDKVNNASHASVSAWALNMLGRNMMPDGVLDLACYAVLAHGHMVATLNTTFPEPFKVEPYWADLWVNEGVVVGWANQIARKADRMDTCALTQLARHFLSRCHGVEEAGEDLADANTWVTTGGDGLKAIFKPTLGKFKNVPTTLQHCRNYEGSYQAFNSPYAGQDYMVPVFGRFTTYKFSQLDRIVAALRDFNITPLDITEIKVVMSHISGALPSSFEQAWEVFLIEWELLNDDEQNAWGRVFRVVQEEYQKLLGHYLEVTANTPMAPLAQKLVASLLSQ